ncbi:MAG TPA: GspH/FimT family pseudopilin [Steroidobacteraceae bacterium]
MKARSRLHDCRGITLLEMVTVMGIVAILMAIAVPSYKYVTNANRIAAEVNGLLGDMQYARGEAIKQGQTVTVCVSNDGATCAGGTVTTWQNGWIVFSDVLNDHTVDPGDAVLRVQSAFTGTDTFTASNNVGFVTFNREGFATGPGIANGAMITLHALVPNSASTRCLSLSLVGLMTVLNAGNSTNNNNTAAVACL